MAGKRHLNPSSLRPALKRLFSTLKTVISDPPTPWTRPSYMISQWMAAINGRDNVDFAQFYANYSGDEGVISRIFQYLRGIPVCDRVKRRILDLEANHLTQFLSGEAWRDGNTTGNSTFTLENTPRQHTEYSELGIDSDDTRTQDADLLYILPPLWGGDDERETGEDRSGGGGEMQEELGIFDGDEEKNSSRKDAISIEFLSVPKITPPKDLKPSYDQVLNLLRRTSRDNRSQPPKKEYFRCQHIRALKKSIRQIEKNKLPGTSIHRLEKGNANQFLTWQKMRKLVTDCGDLLKEMSCTVAGPLTDGKKKRGNEVKTEAKSFNNSFCRAFFQSAVMQAYNILFCDLVYSVSPTMLCAKMKLRCCSAAIHTKSCEDTWADVKRYAQSGMLDELSVQSESAFECLEDGLDLLA